MKRSKLQHPQWYLFAERFKGIHEAEGAADNPEIVRWFGFVDISKGMRHDSTPHCSVFINMAMQSCGYRGTRSAAARSWLTYGQKIWELGDDPALLEQIELGDILIFERPPNPKHGHVTLFAGWVNGARKGMWCLGANQQNQVGTNIYQRAKLIGVRRPTDADRI